MKQILRNIFHSPRFVVGFVIFCIVLLLSFYPMVSIFTPMEIVGSGFHAPGTYVNIKSTIQSRSEELKYVGAAGLANQFTAEELGKMREWLVKYGGVDQAVVDEAAENDNAFLELWTSTYSDDVQYKATQAYKREMQKYNKQILRITATDTLEIGEGDSTITVKSNQFVNVKNISNKVTLPLGTDNFGADVLTKLTSAIGVSLKMGVMAGAIATAIGLTIGLLAGFLGGWVDNILTFFTNLFTVIPSFVILVLIANSISQAGRSPAMVSFIIGITAWPWTARSVRSQVISLRNRDHVNLSKLSGHSTARIIVQDVLPYILSYVIMALILQIGSGILGEAQLSMLGLGPSTTTTATLGLMMNWANTFSAAQNGQWWAFVPVVLAITLVSYSMNLMNTGLDQVFNPQLRD
jgi:ABC-type dipeptide/oligopeptide/nickel transport system permease subunit